MSLTKGFIALGLTLMVTVNLSGCVTALIPNSQVAQTTASALGTSSASITRLGGYQTVYRVDYIEAVSKGQIYYCSMAVPDVMGMVIDIKGTATCHPDKTLEIATAKVLRINPDAVVVHVQKLRSTDSDHHYEITYTANTKKNENYHCAAVGEAQKARLLMKRAPKCSIAVMSN